MVKKSSAVLQLNKKCKLLHNYSMEFQNIAEKVSKNLEVFNKNRKLKFYTEKRSKNIFKEIPKGLIAECVEFTGTILQWKQQWVKVSKIRRITRKSNKT